jgi:hypothetical protein
VTEDVLRFAAARAIGEAGSGSASLRLERPHPSLPGSRVDLAIGEPPEAVIEFNYPCEPIETNAVWTKAFAEILKDLYRLAVHPGDADRILVLALRQHHVTTWRHRLANMGLTWTATHPRIDPRHDQALPKHRTTTRANPLTKQRTAEPTSTGFGRPRCPETSQWSG